MEPINSITYSGSQMTSDGISVISVTDIRSRIAQTKKDFYKKKIHFGYKVNKFR